MANANLIDNDRGVRSAGYAIIRLLGHRQPRSASPWTRAELAITVLLSVVGSIAREVGARIEVADVDIEGVPEFRLIAMEKENTDGE